MPDCSDGNNRSEKKVCIKMFKSYFRPEVDALAGYTPGEQPKMNDLIKLNTNENPYPPSPAVREALNSSGIDLLRRYPDPTADALREAVAARFGTDRSHVICGNGSDDLLTMIFRAFTSPELPLAMPSPAYSLYPVLAAMQGAETIKIPLTAGFDMPADFLEQAVRANLLAIPRPNAPTGRNIPREFMEDICRNFDGIVLIDEAYADFADDNCMDMALRFDNVIVMRTFSKSYSLAGLRLGYAVASPQIIDGLMKLKDSYNLNRLTQALGLAAFNDSAYLEKTLSMVRATRKRLSDELLKRGFKVVPSDANFIFAAPPDGNGKSYFEALRQQAVIVRYFPGADTGNYVRITVGTDAEIDRLLQVTDAYLK